MNNKKALKVGAIGGSLMIASIACAMMLGNSKGAFLRAYEEDHGASCQWNHYSETAATYSHPGVKEFWACCNHPGRHVFEVPTEGTITDKGAFTETIDSTDDRYIPQLVNNHFIRVNLDTNETAVPIYSKSATYYGLRTFTFKARLHGGVADGHGGWFGFGYSESPSTADVYTGMKTGISPSATWDDEWHEYTINMGDSLNADNPGGFFFVFEAGGLISGSYVDLDDFNFGWYWDNQFATDDVESGSSLFELGSGATVVADHSFGVKVNPKQASTNISALYTTDTFTKISEISFKVKVEADASDGWWGFGISTAADFYGGGMNSLYKLSGSVSDYKTYKFYRPLADDLTYWRLMVDGVDKVKETNWGYNATDVAHVALVTSTANTAIYIYDINIVAEEGTFTDNFTDESAGIFTAEAGCTEYFVL